MDQNFFINLKQTIGRNRRNSTIPVIRDAFAGWIRAHRKECSEKLLPSVSLLAETLGVARQTIRKVYLSLEELQLITRNKGERHWFIRPFHHSSLLNIALLLPMRFSDYYLPSTEYGQRHFGVFSGIADRALEQGYALIPMRRPAPPRKRSRRLWARSGAIMSGLSILETDVMTRTCRSPRFWNRKTFRRSPLTVNLNSRGSLP